jgi:hypothetical protein
MQYTVTTPTGTREVNIVWPEGFKKVAITAGGGFDSSLLLWLYANLPTPEGCELVVATTMHGPGADVFAKNIVAKISELTGKTFEHFILPVAPTTKSAHQVSFPTSIAMRRGMFECLIGADTTNTPELDNLEGAPVRLTLDVAERYINAKHPFLHLDKSHTVQLAHDLGLDWLPKMTHTCTESPDIRCGRCWQCSERAWAFNLLGLEDTGTF